MLCHLNISATLRLLILLAVLASSGAAQEQKGGVKAEILTLSLSGVIKDLHYATREGVATTTVYSRGFGIPINYEGPQEIVFFRPVSNPQGFTGADRKIVSRVVLPPGGRRFLLLFEKMADTEREIYRITPVKNDAKNMPAGSYRLLNLSSFPIVGELGKNRIRLDQEESLILSDRGDENGNFEVRLFSAEKGKEKMVYSSVWQAKKTRRVTVFFLESSSDREALKVQKFIEPYTEPEKD